MYECMCTSCGKSFPHGKLEFLCKECDSKKNYAAEGRHVLLTLHNGDYMADANHVLYSIRRAAIAIGATVLHEYTHSFGEGLGVTAMCVLAESHISIHTYPETNGKAFVDIFTCGTNINPLDAIPLIAFQFNVELWDVSVQEIIRR